MSAHVEDSSDMTDYSTYLMPAEITVLDFHRPVVGVTSLDDTVMQGLVHNSIVITAVAYLTRPQEMIVRGRTRRKDKHWCSVHQP